MNYDETLAYLYSQLPMFQRIGPAAYKSNLNNILALCKILGNPEKSLTSIHVAGTNGKGSVSHMMASILQEAGYKTGLFTSPHLTDFRERIRINGNKIPEAFVVDFVKKYKQQFEEIQPSFFEMTTGMAFKFFEEEKADISVFEVGMGGRLDSTNVIQPELSIITNISKDHTQFLGNTLEKIALEKAGIIKKNVPVIIGETNDETGKIFRKIAMKNSSEIFFADAGFLIKKSEEIIEYANKNKFYNKLEIIDNSNKPLSIINPLLGSYQQRNIITTLQSVKILNDKGYSITSSHVTNGIQNTIENTGIRGRWQILNSHPLIVCDIGHNEGGISEVIKMIKKTRFKTLHMVFGAVDDKNIDPVLNQLPTAAKYYFCKAKIPRAMDEDKLLKLAREKGIHGESYESIDKAVNKAIKNANQQDVIFIGGSTFVVAEALQLLECL